MALSFPCSVKRRRRLSFSSGRAEPADQPLAAQAAAAHPHHFRIGGGLIKKHQVSWVKHARARSSADAPVLRRRVAAPPRAGFFLNVMLCRLKRRGLGLTFLNDFTLASAGWPLVRVARRKILGGAVAIHFRFRSKVGASAFQRAGGGHLIDACGLRLQGMRLQPKCPRSQRRIDAGALPPQYFIAMTMNLSVVTPA